MLGCQIQGYKRACAPTTGGVGLLMIADANDFNFIKGDADAAGNPTGYESLERRGGTGATATAVLTSTVVSSVTVGAGGTGYDEAPQITFTGGAGTGATGTATVAGGVITGITITAGGTGYTSPPTVVIGGSGLQYFFEIDSVGDSIGVEVNQTFFRRLRLFPTV